MAEAPIDLDAYSRHIVSVVEAVGPAVVGIHSRRGRRNRQQGGGSGIIFPTLGIDSIHKILTPGLVGRRTDILLLRKHRLVNAIVEPADALPPT